MLLHGDDSINIERIKQKAQILKSGRAGDVECDDLSPLHPPQQKTESNESASA